MSGLKVVSAAEWSALVNGPEAVAASKALNDKVAAEVAAFMVALVSGAWKVAA